MMLKQLIPQEVCLKCLGCCRFSEAHSVWSPCLLEEEIQGLLDKKDIPAASISAQKRLMLVADQSGNFLCPFLDTETNKCRIYTFRPFECRLYPFLICLRGKKINLTLDLNCPYIKENINQPQIKDYIEYLNAELNSPQQVKLLKENPQILQAYEDVLDVLELKTC